MNRGNRPETRSAQTQVLDSLLRSARLKAAGQPSADKTLLIAGLRSPVGGTAAELKPALSPLAFLPVSVRRVNQVTLRSDWTASTDSTRRY